MCSNIACIADGQAHDKLQQWLKWQAEFWTPHLLKIQGSWLSVRIADGRPFSSARIHTCSSAAAHTDCNTQAVIGKRARIASSAKTATTATSVTHKPDGEKEKRRTENTCLVLRPHIHTCEREGPSASGQLEVFARHSRCGQQRASHGGPHNAGDSQQPHVRLLGLRPALLQRRRSGCRTEAVDCGVAHRQNGRQAQRRRGVAPAAAQTAVACNVAQRRRPQRQCRQQQGQAAVFDVGIGGIGAAVRLLGGKEEKKQKK